LSAAEADLPTWLTQAIVPVSDIHKAEFDVIRGPTAGGPPKLAEACKELGTANAGLQKLMPTPNPELSAEVQQAIDGFETAVEFCPTAVKELNPDNFEALWNDLTAAEQHLASADAIIVSLYPKG
jgi:hypothetical protein